MYILHYCFDDSPTAVPVLCQSPDCPTPTAITIHTSDPLAQAEWIEKYAEMIGANPDSFIFIHYTHQGI